MLIEYKIFDKKLEQTVLKDQKSKLLNKIAQ